MMELLDALCHTFLVANADKLSNRDYDRAVDILDRMKDDFQDIVSLGDKYNIYTGN